jgi:hypothetical protein
MGALLEDGGDLVIECGQQGLFMFYFDPYFDGFEPDGENVPIDVMIDVEGFNLDPDGHFFADEVPHYVGCGDPCNGAEFCPVGIAAIVPDELLDVGAMDGAAATLHFALDAGGELLEIDATATVVAVADEGWEGCSP